MTRKRTCIFIAFLYCSDQHVAHKNELLCLDARLGTWSEPISTKIKSKCVISKGHDNFSCNLQIDREHRSIHKNGKKRAQLYLSSSVNTDASKGPCTNGFADSTTFMPSLYAKYLLTCIGTYMLRSTSCMKL